ncbi:MAG: ABC transporter permease [Aggregatilineales bacterium]|uniref:ABC transporter permease n=1 Tax=Candidatus Roseilinea sp. TaxID=2838777 RepID=UPI00404ABD6D
MRTAMRVIARYIGLLRLFVRSSLLTSLEYRVNFAGALLMSLLDALWAVGGALLFYSHRATVGGWSFHEALIVIGLFFVASGFLDAVMQPNVRDVIEAVRTGAMDYALVKPLNPMFHVTLRRYRFEKLSSLLVGAALIGYALFQLQLWPGLGQWIGFLALGLAAMLLLYALMALLAALCFWVVDIANIDELVSGALEAARFPAQAFPEPARSVILFVVPIAFVSTVPAEALLGRLTPALALYGLACVGVVLLLSVRAWRWAVAHYTSASS